MLHRISTLARDVGKTVLVSTHILPDVRAICDTVAIMVQGEVRVVDSLETLSRPASPAVHVRPSNDAAALIRRVEAEGGQVAVNEDGSLQVVVAGAEAAGCVWRWAAETGVGIRSLVPSRNSLEQIFLDAVRGDRRADP
jgi:ABC-2 type transport system ATP-binding protein